ncbi:hypothetical protein D9M69_537140 [compost metagenome]
MRGRGRTGHHGLVALQHVGVAIAARTRLDVVQATACLHFGLCPSDAHIAGDDAANQTLGQRTAGATQYAATDHHCRQVRLQHQGTTEGFHHNLVLDCTAAETAQGLGERCGEDAQFFGKGTPAIGPPAFRGSRRGHALLETVLLVQITREHVAEHLLFVAEAEIHCAFLRVFAIGG